MLPRIQRKMDHGIVSTIKPLLESWAGIKLSHEGMPQPGGRRYLRGANMLMHVDAKSHLIGAILQVSGSSRIIIIFNHLSLKINEKYLKTLYLD